MRALYYDGKLTFEECLLGGARRHVLRVLRVLQCVAVRCSVLQCVAVC